MPYRTTDTSWSEQEARAEAYVAWVTKAEREIPLKRRSLVEEQVVLRPTTKPPTNRRKNLDNLLANL